MLGCRNEVLEEFLVEELPWEIRIHTQHVHVLVILFAAVPRDIVRPERHEHYQNILISGHRPHGMWHQRDVWTALIFG
jgi:hypothetical protein